MLISPNSGNGKAITVSQAVEDKLLSKNDEGYIYIETLQDILVNQSKMIATLIECLVNKNLLTSDDMQYMLGYSYEITED